MENKIYDIVVIGGGPAGLTAALYALRNGKSALVIEKSVFGGQIANSPNVENIPGFKSISGDEFADLYLDQVMGQGGDVMIDEAVGAKVLQANDAAAADEAAAGEAAAAEAAAEIKVTLASGAEILGRTLVLATGTKHRLLGLPGEEDLIGNGISFCAVCDGDFYAGKKVVMIGGGNSAFVEAVLLADIVGELVMLQDLPTFTADMKLQDQLFSHNNIETHVSTKILDFITEGGTLKGVRYLEDGQKKEVMCDGVFLAIGLVPDNEAFKEIASLDERGYFDAGESCQTKLPNVFVAGDARTKSLRQVTTACADGAIAAIAACGYINSKK